MNQIDINKIRKNQNIILKSVLYGKIKKYNIFKISLNMKEV